MKKEKANTQILHKTLATQFYKPHLKATRRMHAIPQCREDTNVTEKRLIDPHIDNLIELNTAMKGSHLRPYT
jgi:hypothetical protein